MRRYTLTYSNVHIYVHIRKHTINAFLHIQMRTYTYMYVYFKRGKLAKTRGLSAQDLPCLAHTFAQKKSWIWQPFSPKISILEAWPKAFSEAISNENIGRTDKLSRSLYTTEAGLSLGMGDRGPKPLGTCDAPLIGISCLLVAGAAPSPRQCRSLNQELVVTAAFILTCDVCTTEYLGLDWITVKIERAYIHVKNHVTSGLEASRTNCTTWLKY